MSEEVINTDTIVEPASPKMIDMSKYREIGPEDLARMGKERERRAVQSWMDEYTWWGYANETTNTRWGSEFVAQIEADLEANGFILDRNHVDMTRRFLYWCWVMKSNFEYKDSTDNDIPFPCVSKYNSNNPDEAGLFYNTFDCHYWAKLEDTWKPEWMTLLMASYFFSNLQHFFWRHVSTEDSPTIQKERELVAELDEDGSGDERGAADQGSYFKGKKEMY